MQFNLLSLFILIIQFFSSSSISIKKNIVLYDGVCNFCNKWVDILLKLDSQKQFTFSALQSDKGKELLEAIGKNKNDISSVVFIKELGEKKESNEVLLYQYYFDAF
jgi:predicted DCC family thiol-disulfide oxidoreductase YuxK